MIARVFIFMCFFFHMATVEQTAAAKTSSLNSALQELLKRNEKYRQERR